MLGCLPLRIDNDLFMEASAPGSQKQTFRLLLDANHAEVNTKSRVTPQNSLSKEELCSLTHKKKTTNPNPKTTKL